MPLAVRDVMTTDPVTVSPDDTLADAIELLRRHHIHGLPVVEDRKVLGIITDRDLRTMLGPGARTADLGLLVKADASVRSIMSMNTWTIAPDAPLSEAARVLGMLRVGALPVVDGDGLLIGIVSVSDVLGAAAKLLEQAGT
jgi:acetoin utilization protein AcuB